MRATSLTPRGHVRLCGAILVLAWVFGSPTPSNAVASFEQPSIPGASDQAVVLGEDLDGDGDPDEV